MIRIILAICISLSCLSAARAQDYYLPQESVTDRSMSSTTPLANGAFVLPFQVAPGASALSIPSPDVDGYMRLSGNRLNTNITVNTMPGIGNSRDVLSAIATPVYKPLPMQPLSPNTSWMFSPDGSAAKMTVLPDGSPSIEYFEPTRAPRGVMRTTN